jgi:hypothetical protein
MAITAVTPVKLVRNVAAKYAPVASDATLGTSIVVDGMKDDHLVLLFVNADATNAEEVKILKGNGLQGIADLTISIPKSESYALCIEYAKYLNVSGTNKGKIMITATADVSIAAIEAHHQS